MFADHGDRERDDDDEGQAADHVRQLVAQRGRKSRQSRDHPATRQRAQQAREGLEQQAQQAQQVPQDERLQVRLQNDRHQDRTHFDTQLCQFLFIKT